MAAAAAADAGKFELRARIHASIEFVVRCFTDAHFLTRMMRSPARTDGKAGSPFEWCDGSIHGKYEEVESSAEAGKIRMSWRFRDWREGEASDCTMTFTPAGDGVCTMELRQTDIPEVDKHGNSKVRQIVASGWKERIFFGLEKIVGLRIDWL